MLIHIVSAFEQSGRIDDSVRQGYQGVTCDQARRSASATPACGQLIPALRQISPIAVLPWRVGNPSQSSGRSAPRKSLFTPRQRRGQRSFTLTGFGRGQGFGKYAKSCARQCAKRSSGIRFWYLVEGGVMIVAGILPLVYPVVSFFAAVFALGRLLIISGIAQDVSLIDAREVPHFWLQLVSVVLS
jgi:Short repeat of unknown function (DUF308)